MEASGLGLMIYHGAVRETVSILGVSNSNGFNTAN